MDIQPETLGLLSVVVGLVVYVWLQYEDKVNKLQTAHYALEKVILEHYWNKEATQQHIDLVLKPVIQSLDNVAAELRNLTKTLASTYKG